jgi:hypothetical protein
MEAWGIIMTAFTLFGMLTLLIASLTTDKRPSATAAMTPPVEADSAGSELKEAA